MNVDNPYVILV